MDFSLTFTASKDEGKFRPLRVAGRSTIAICIDTRI